MIRVACALLLALGFTSLAMAQDKPKTGFVNKTFKNADGTTSQYVVFVPRDYDGTKEYPVILFLHGAGETKSDKTGAKMPVNVGIGPAIKKREKDFPFIVVIPQAEAAKSKIGGRWHADAPDGKRAIAILDEVMKEYKVDAKRQYLTGLSMGGFGTWHMAFSHPDRWAAIVPICGGGDPKGAEKIKDIPCWCFHGADDPTVKADLSRSMIEAIKKAGGEPKYTEYPGVGHNSWDKAYGTDELYTWLLEHRKK
jgi:predicted peptidase